MGDGRVYLDELNTKSVSYKVKVKVMQKGKPQKSVNDVLYQMVVLQDDKGNKMRGVLYGTQVSAHVDALVCNGVYEIANAPIKPLLNQYRRDPAELPYTMGFGYRTLIHPLSTMPGPVLPEYTCVSQVPKTATPFDIFDVIGTLLYVEPAAREVTTKQGRKNTVREVIISDHSTEQPIVVSAWNDLAGGDCDKLASLVTSLPVIGFSALRIATYRGFSLTGTMSTVINTGPTGAKADALIEWGSRNEEFLTDLQARINRLRDPNTPIGVVTLSALMNKKAKGTLQDERYHLNVTVPAPAFHKVNAYLGCSHCGKRSDYAAGETFKCETCTKDGVVSEPRITFNCEVSDGTDQLEITAFTADTSNLFQMSGADIFYMKHSDDKTTFEKVCASLKSEPFTIEVSPKTELSRNNILQWALRHVVTAPPQTVPSQAATQEPEIVVTTTEQPAPVARQLDFGGALEGHSDLALVDVAVTSEYATLRKLPASITLAHENIQLQHASVQVTSPTHDPTSATPQTVAASPSGTLPSIITLPATPLLKAPKVEKSAACNPETPAQNTPKRTNAKQTDGSPSNKKKATTSLPANH